MSRIRKVFIIVTSRNLPILAFASPLDALDFVAKAKTSRTPKGQPRARYQIHHLDVTPINARHKVKRLLASSRLRVAKHRAKKKAATP